MNSDELISRRRFFKKAAQGVLPMIGIAVFGSSFLTSCSKSDHNGCEDCALSCSDYCGSSCEGSCDGSSTTSPSCSECSSGCQTTCTGSCSNTCTNSSANNQNGPDNNNGVSDASGVVDGYEYVDLGLSVKWARYNMGANIPEGKGTLQKSLKIPDNILTKEGRKGNIGGTSYDFATSRWGKHWQLPSIAEFEELKNNCKCEYITYKGCLGTKFTSRKNGNIIFLPAAGWYSDGKKYDEDECIYWTSDIFKFYLSGEIGIDGYCFNEKKAGYECGTFEYGDKLSARPVTGSNNGNSSGCNGTCTANCANNSSSSGCSSCADSCSNGCKTSCSYNCAATCKTGCGGSCNTSCGGKCTYVSAGSGCSGCATTCYNQCYATCDLACANNCQSSCVNGSK